MKACNTPTLTCIILVIGPEDQYRRRVQVLLYGVLIHLTTRKGVKEDTFARKIRILIEGVDRGKTHCALQIEVLGQTESRAGYDARSFDNV